MSPRAASTARLRVAARPRLGSWRRYVTTPASTNGRTTGASDGCEPSSTTITSRAEDGTVWRVSDRSVSSSCATLLYAGIAMLTRGSAECNGRLLEEPARGQQRLHHIRGPGRAAGRRDLPAHRPDVLGEGRIGHHPVDRGPHPGPGH